MSVVSDKYRGTITYVRVLRELVRAAEYRGVTTYQDIALIMRLPQSGSHMGREVGHILGEISEDEFQADRAHAQRGGCQRERQTRIRFLHPCTRAWSAMQRGRGTGFLGR